MKVFLIGFMGVGKSTMGKPLSEYLQLPFFDLDDYIESSESVTVEHIFENKGEKMFREIESHYLKEIVHQNDSFLLACGGGTPCFGENMELMKQVGIVVWLDMPILSLIHRLNAFKANRPLIAQLDNGAMKRYVEDLYSKRKPFYSKAHIQFQVDEYHMEDFLNLGKQIVAYCK